MGPPLQEAGEPTKREKQVAAAEAANTFRTTFLENRIWLDEDLCEKIAQVDKELFTVFIEFTTYQWDDPNVRSEHLATWHATWKKMENDVPPLRLAIERRFREMLGVGAAP